MSSVYNDEMLKKSKKQSDIDNYNIIQGFKNDYIAAEKAGDTEGMKRAHQNAEAVRATYGYSGGESGDNYVQLNPVGNGNNSNSFFGNAYKDIGRMQNEGYNAYSDVINKQTKGMIESIGRNKNIVNENYNLAYEELNKSKEKTLEKLPEDMAKLGIYGSGTGETAYSKIQSGYAGELKKLLADKNKALTDIDNQIRDLENQSATQIAQYYAEMMQKNPELYLSMLNNQYNEFVNNRNYDYQLERDKISDENWNKTFEFNANQYSDQRADTEYSKKVKNAEIAAQYGNYQPLIDLGILTEADVQKYKELQTSKGTNTSYKKTTDSKLKESEVTSWVNYLNNSLDEQYPGYKALKSTGKNMYAPADVSSEYIIVRVLNSNDLTQEQKDYLLYDKFGITEEQVDTVLKDKHYR